MEVEVYSFTKSVVANASLHCMIHGCNNLEKQETNKQMKKQHSSRNLPIVYLLATLDVYQFVTQNSTNRTSLLYITYS